MLNKRETVNEQEVERKMMTRGTKAPYEKPVLTRHQNLRDLTFECPGFQCSVVVPPPPN